jgi:hypothetical protein
VLLESDVEFQTVRNPVLKKSQYSKPPARGGNVVSLGGKTEPKNTPGSHPGRGVPAHLNLDRFEANGREHLANEALHIPSPGAGHRAFPVGGPHFQGLIHTINVSGAGHESLVSVSRCSPVCARGRLVAEVSTLTWHHGGDRGYGLAHDWVGINGHSAPLGLSLTGNPNTAATRNRLGQLEEKAPWLLCRLRNAMQTVDCPAQRRSSFGGQYRQILRVVLRGPFDGPIPGNRPLAHRPDWEEWLDVAQKSR